ncbi:MAG TPA: cupin domain-containing protein [Dehalococcoidia bacterium]|nr:cupin domain-containing protein [Dehalococcoidia bacterium]
MSEQGGSTPDQGVAKVHLPRYSSVETRPGMRHRDIVGEPLGVTSFFIGDSLLAPGSGVPLHTHPIEEVLIALEGDVTVVAGDETIQLSAEEAVVVPPGVPHKFQNRSGSQARLMSAAPWDRATFFREATTYLEGAPREGNP